MSPSNPILTRAQAAIKNGSFTDEIAAYEVAGRKGPVMVSDDEKPGTVDAAKIPTLRAAFEKDGTVTAGSSSAISDGAAALVPVHEHGDSGRHEVHDAKRGDGAHRSGGGVHVGRHGGIS